MAKKSKKQNTHRNSKKQAVTNRKSTIQSKQNSVDENNSDDDIDLLSEKMDSASLNHNRQSNRFASIISDHIQLNEQPSGLPNLGNTCYFNSIMQVMGQTYILHHMLKERCQEEFVWEAKTFYWDEKSQSFASEFLHLKLPPPNSLVFNFLQVQQQIFLRKSISPRALLSDVQREKHQFKGFAQQDAQELLITLLDALKKSEISRQKESLLKALKIEDYKNSSQEDREKAQRYKITAKHTIVDSIFGGQLLSIIHCTVCDYRSFTFEPFMDLALSLDSDKPQIQNNLEDLQTAANTKKSFQNKNNKKNCNKSKKNNVNNEESDNESSPLIKNSLIFDTVDQDLNSLSDRKKRRKEKKAAKRAERKQMKLKIDQKSKILSEDEYSSIKTSNYQKDRDRTDDYDQESDENHKKSSILKEDIKTKKVLNGNISYDDIEINYKQDNHIYLEQIASIEPSSDDAQISFDDKSPVDLETSQISNSSTSSSSSNHKIKDDFRYKFHLFAHQRMSNSDDDYQNLDLGTLLRNFIKEETLDGPNKYLCENCSKLNNGQKIYSKAIRCQLIALPPPVLILQLKRFEASGFGFNKRVVASMYKLNTKISFPEKLYLSPYTSRIYEYFSRFYEPECGPEEISDMNEQRLEYTLYGVVIHSGSLRFGHYMAYVCVRQDSFNFQNLKRFLHLKPFVSNIEHIIQMVDEDLTSGSNGNQQQINQSINKNTNYNEKSLESDDLIENNDNNPKQKYRRWYFISDSSVSTIKLDKVLHDATSPYLLFYERTK